MKRLILCVALVLVGVEQVVGGVITIDTVPVGNLGNAGELSGEGAYGYGEDRICGTVNYAYNIGKYEVTAGQYRDFLNAVAATDPYGLYDTKMVTYGYGCKITRSGVSGSYAYDFSLRPSGTEADWAERPVNYVSWYDAARFSNWMTTGDTESGVYAFSSGTLQSIMDHQTAGTTYGTAYFLPTEDEWYKAAYHKNDGVTGNYFDYPTSSNDTPGRDMSEATNPGNNANYYGNPCPIDSAFFRTVAGEFELSESPYGTFDQGGNVWELIEPPSRVRGGSAYMYTDAAYMHASYRDWTGGESFLDGFRVASTPEPGSIAMLGGLALMGLLYWWRRRKA